MRPAWAANSQKRIPLTLAAGLFAALLAQSALLAAPAGAQEASLFGTYLAGREAATLRDNAASAEYYRQALELDPGNEVIMERILALDLTTGNIEAGAKMAAELVKTASAHKLSRLTLAIDAIRARQFKTARRHLEQADPDGPIGNLTETFLTAWAHQGAADTDKALEVLGDVGASQWQRLYSAYMSGLVAELAGRKELAETNLKDAAEREGASVRIVEAYARYLMRNQQWEEAAKVVADIEAKLPDHILVTALRDDLDARRKVDPAITTAAKGAAETLYSIGSAIGREGDDLATAYLQLALYLDPESELALLALAETYQGRDQYELALQYYDRIPETSALRDHAQVQAAFNLNSADRKDESVARLEDLLKKKPDLPVAIVALGNIEQGRKNWNRSAELFTQAIGLHGGDANWNLYYWRGIAHERSMQWPKAEADFKKAMQLKPDEPLILNYLGYSWIDQGINLKEGLELVKKAVALRPNDGFIVDSLGWAYYRLGDYDAAARELERAVELRPQDPTINDHLGDAYWKNNRKIEAKFQWSHARDLDPEPEDLERILKKLETGLTEEKEPDNVAADQAKPAQAGKNGG